MVILSIINKNKKQAENLSKLLGEYYYVDGIYKNINSLISYKKKKTLPAVILFCNNEIDDFSKLQKELVKSQIIIYNNLSNDKLLFNAINTGIKNYVHYSQKPSELLSIIETVSIGGCYVNQNFTPKLLLYIKDVTTILLGKNIKKHNTLTSREVMVFELLLVGYTYKEIAETLFITIDTVRKHVCSIYGKMNVHSRGELMNIHYNKIVKSKKYIQLFIKPNINLSI